MADRVTLVTVQHHLRLGGGAGGEVQQHRVGGQRAALGFELLGMFAGGAVRGPAGGGRTNADAAAVFTQPDELVDMGATDHQVGNMATLDAVAQVVGGQQGGGGNDHSAEFEGGQHGFPQSDVIAEHQQDAFAAAHAQGTQVIGHLVGARGQLLEAVALFAAVLFDDPQGIGLVALGHGVKVIQSPVELGQLWPAEITHSCGVIGAVFQQEVSGGEERLAVVVHWSLPRRARVPERGETTASKNGFTVGALFIFIGTDLVHDQAVESSIGRHKSNKNAQKIPCVVQKSMGLLHR
ncbi:hypothetical protein D9M73_131860 [compost metagenome]